MKGYGRYLLVWGA